MMGMATALIYNVVGLTKKYFSYPVSVKLSVDHQQELTFPSVTVCNMSPIKKSAWQAVHDAEVKSRRKRAIGFAAVILTFMGAYNNNFPGRSRAIENIPSAERERITASKGTPRSHWAGSPEAESF